MVDFKGIFGMSKNSSSDLTIKDKIFAHIEIWRPYTVIWCGLVSLAGACLANRAFPPLTTSILVTIIPIMGWIAGLYLIDFIDRKLDIIQKPHRPIPSGRIKREEALIFGAVFVIIGFLLTFLLNPINLFLIFIVAILVFSYAKFTKSRGIIGNINRGLVTVSAYFFGVFSINLSIQSISSYIWFFSLLFLIHDTNSNMVGAIRDIEGDKKGGYITLPVKLGIKKTGYISLLMTVIWFSLVLFFTLYYEFLKNEFYLVLIIDLLILISFYVYLFNSMKKYSRKKALNYHKFFVIERIVMASAIIFGIADLYISLIIFLIAIIITSTFQYALRDRYEFREIK